MAETLQPPHLPSTVELPDEPADGLDTELDSLADKLGSYELAKIYLGLMPPYPVTSELPVPSMGKSEKPFGTPSGHVRFTEPGAADNNLKNGYGMTERLTPEQIAINDAGLKLVRGALAAVRAKASAETEPKPEVETEQPTLF